MTDTLEYRTPLVVVGGPTGVGKTDLAISLCKVLDGEIVGADSMQVYKSLDALSNKITPQESRDIIHHIIDLVEISDEFDVTAFRETALSVIQKIKDCQRTPIVVGGTNYYLESLIYENLISIKDEQTYSEFSNIQLWDMLNDVDPSRASMLHWNDRRRIRRSLNVAASGTTHSHLIGNQISDNRNRLKLRFKKILFFWLISDSEVLAKRIKERCEKMLQNGGWNELQRLYHYFTDSKMPENDLRGACQVIGFRQFLPCLKSFRCDYTDLPIDLRDSCFSKFVQSTIKYTKKQVKWFKNRIKKDERIHVFELNLSSMNLESAVGFCKLKFDGIISESLDNSENSPSIKSPLTRYVCDLCQKTCIGDASWHSHLKSKNHRRLLSMKRKVVTPINSTVSTLKDKYGSMPFSE
ncbi:tRNA dimethylallyltransferase, mitochondrial [Thelohanellus kitauei]|uniref:tRNA dimethylallyltransferase, mitochondrial n=1 Tax=Thelohanellus kitauei TaxID=669202 RepID=A0A0C2IR08_THEKT|nr:tRNA dimethylallyltransferase, mitochondrial [Thelohanellus kitauei]